MEENIQKKRGRKKGTTPKVLLQVRIPKDLEDAVNSAAMYVTGGNKNAYVCQLIYKDLEANHEKYRAAEEEIRKAKNMNSQ